jgi:hypothetical protein
MYRSEESLDSSPAVHGAPQAPLGSSGVNGDRDRKNTRDPSRDAPSNNARSNNDAS